MSDYWKSTPKYWCKHCSTYVRDTKLERANHESTAKHQGAIKRALRDLHRGHEREEREKERAKREIDRLNGVAFSSGSRQNEGLRGSSGGASSVSQQATEAQRQRQLEQLAEMGVNIPDQLRSDMAMAGEWTVTATRVVEEADEDGTKEAVATEARATGVRKRELEKTEEEKEEEDAVRSLFKKPKRWGRDSRTMPAEDDAELDALLSGSLVRPPKNEERDDGPKVKNEETIPDEEAGHGGGTIEPQEEEVQAIKREPDDAGDIAKAEPSLIDTPEVKKEGTTATDTPSVVFKKRKTKNIRQK